MIRETPHTRWLMRRRLVALAVLLFVGFTVLSISMRARERAAMRERLEHASLSGSLGERTIRPNWLKSLGPLGKLDIGARRIVALNLARIDEDILRDVERLAYLEDLHLHHAEPPVTDADMKHLIGLRELRFLLLSNSRIEGDGLRHLSGHSKLEHLYLHSTPLRSEGLRHLGQITSLRLLILSNTEVTDEGLAHLKGLSSLQSLHLTDTKITDAGLAHLNGLVSLRGLDLTNTNVTDAGLVHLTGLTQLEYLNLTNTHVTDEGVRAFRAALPACGVAHGE